MASHPDSPVELSPKSIEFVSEPDTPDLFLSVLSRIQSSLDNNNALLATLIENRAN